jgi:hypothetical protein
VLFYGDHLPALSNSYQITGFIDAKDMLSQAGTWLLVDPHQQGQSAQEDTAAWLLPGKLLEQAGIHDDAYFALTGLIGPQLATLTAAPGAPPLDEGSDEQMVDQAMASIDQLRMDGKLDKLLPKPTPPPSGGAAHNSIEPAQPRTTTALPR